MRGRKPKPTQLKVLDGNPGRRPLNDREPQPPEGAPEPPEFLDAEARAEWFRTAGVLQQMGTLSKADRAPLAAFCTDQPIFSKNFTSMFSNASSSSITNTFAISKPP